MSGLKQGQSSDALNPKLPTTVEWSQDTVMIMIVVDNGNNDYHHSGDWKRHRSNRSWRDRHVSVFAYCMYQGVPRDSFILVQNGGDDVRHAEGLHLTPRRGARRGKRGDL